MNMYILHAGILIGAALLALGFWLAASFDTKTCVEVHETPAETLLFGEYT